MNAVWEARHFEQSCQAVLAAAEISTNLRVFVSDPSGADSYPIVTLSWILLRKSYESAETADAVRDLFRWCLEDGQRYSSQLAYVPVPNSVSEKALAALNSIKSGG